MLSKLLIALVLAMNHGGTEAMVETAEIIMKHSQEFMKNGTECKAKVGATDEDIKIFFAKKLPDSKTGDCMIACMMEKMEVLKDGKFMEEAPLVIAKNILGHEDMVAEIIGDISKNCAKKLKPGGEVCETAKAVAQCGFDHVKKIKDSVKE